MNIEELPKEFIGVGEVKGFKFVQIEQGLYAYVYQVNGGHYEVFERKYSSKLIDFDKRLYSETEFKETYPSARLFGSTAFSCKNLGDARNKFREINEKVKERHKKMHESFLRDFKGL